MAEGNLFNLEAEKEVIGGLLFNAGEVAEVFEIVEEGDFYLPDLKNLFKIIKTRWEKGEVISSVAVAEDLRAFGFNSNPFVFVSSLLDCFSIPSSCIESAKIVRNKSILRRLLEVSDKLKDMVNNPQVDTEKTIEEAERLIYNIAINSRESLEHIAKYIAEVDNRLQGLSSTSLGFLSGYSFLDDTISGLRKGELIIIAGRPSMGKTALALNMLYNLAKQNIQVALFSLEMDSISIATRLIALDSGVPIYQVRGVNNPEIRENCLESFAFLSSLPIYINDNPLVDTARIRSILRRNKHVQAIFVDHIQQMRLGGYESRVSEVTEIARELKSIAREFNIPVIALSQLSRGVEGRQDKRPLLSDLRESGAIEQEADVVMLLYRPDYYAKGEEKEQQKIVKVEIEIAKNRNGATRTIGLNFNKETNLFWDIDKVVLD